MIQVSDTTGLLSILTTNILAGGFNSLSYGQGLEEKTFIDEQGDSHNFQNLQSIHFKLGTNHFPIEEEPYPIGVYLDIALGRSDLSDYTLGNKGEKLKYENMLANIGLTYSLNNYFVLFGGMGISHSSAEFKDEEKITKPLWTKSP